MKIRLCAFADEAGTSLKEQIGALKDNNIPFVELRTIDGVNIADIDEENAKGICKELHKNGIKVWSLGSPVGKSSIDCDEDFELNRLKKLLRLAKIFDCDKIRVFSFFDVTDEKKSEAYKRLNDLVSLAAKSGVMLYHENEKDIHGDSIKNVRELLSNVKGLKSIYDPANYIQCGQDINAALKVVLPLADYLHIKDALFSTGEVVPSGYGDGEIANTILKLRNDCTLTLEPHLRVFDGYSIIDNSSLKNRFEFKSGREAFDIAVKSLKDILNNVGFKEEEGVWTR